MDHLNALFGKLLTDIVTVNERLADEVDEEEEEQ